MPTVSVLDASGNPVDIETPPPPGRAGAAASGSVAACTEDKAVFDAIAAALVAIRDLGTEYEAVAAGLTDQPLGASGAAGDRLVALIIQPGTTSPGSVILKDNGAAIYTFPGGANSVSTLHPILVAFNLKSLGALTVSTGANVSVLAIGDFT